MVHVSTGLANAAVRCPNLPKTTHQVAVATAGDSTAWETVVAVKITSVKITTNLSREAEVTAEAVAAMKVVAVAEAELPSSTVPSEEAISAAAEEAAVEVISKERSAHMADATSMPHKPTTAAGVTGETKRRQLWPHQLSKKRLHPTNHANKKVVVVISAGVEVISAEVVVILVAVEVISAETAEISAACAVIVAVVE